LAASASVRSTPTLATPYEARVATVKRLIFLFILQKQTKQTVVDEMSRKLISIVIWKIWATKKILQNNYYAMCVPVENWEQVFRNGI
jgi:hypothetical protein